MPHLRQDLAGAIRRARRQPWFALAACALLALAIGGNTATWMLLQAVMLRPLPVHRERDLAALYVVRSDTPRGPISLPLFLDLAGMSTLAGVAACFQWSANLTDSGDAERLQGMRVSGNYFELLGAQAALGRVLGEIDAAAAPRAVLITDGLWKRRFGGSRDVVGQPIRLNGDVLTIVGVLPPSFPMQIRDAEVVAPWSPAADPRRANPSLAFLRAVGRLGPGATHDRAREELTSRLRAFREQYPQTNVSDRAHVVPFRTDLIGGSPRLLALLGGGMGLVMLIAAANLANLLLVRGASRLQEFATRRALGATRGRLLAQLLTETLLLAGIGIAAGLGLAPAAAAGLVAAGGTAVPAVAGVALDATAVAMAIVSGLCIAIAAAILPAVQLTTKAGSAAAQRAVTIGGRRLRAAIVCAEVALAVLLLVGAGLLVRSFLAVQRVNLGFQPSGVLTLRLSLPRARYPLTRDLETFHLALAERVKSLSGVAAVASANVVPMNNYLATTAIRPPGFEAQAPGAWPDVHYRMVSAAYFEALGIPVLSGRAFDDADRRDSMPVAIVSRGLARKYWPAGNAVGSRILLRDDNEKSRAVEIVGVVEDVRHLGPEVASPSEIYVPIPQVPDATSIWLANNMYFAVKTPQDPLSLAAAVRRELARVDADVAASFVRSMDQWVGLAVQARRFNLIVIAVFALTALLLAATGVYSVAAEAVAVRTRELGVRAALGASDGQLRRAVMKDGLAPVAGGVLLGAGLALASSGVLTSFLYGVDGRDPATFAGVVALAAVAGALGVYLPSRRVTQIDPVVALRTE